MSDVYPLDMNSASPVAVVIVVDDDGSGYDAETGTSLVNHNDGDIDISWGDDARPRSKISTGFDENIAELLSDSELSMLAEKLLLAIEGDIQSRSEWMENMSSGISLLALQVKNARGAAVSGSAPAEGVSTVDHPLLLEAVLRFQANALGELLPADGPVKVRNDGENGDVSDMLAEALEKDLNHYLTKTATEYYPDTDRMLLLLGFCGISFKKGFHDPIKRRPVIASINAEDLIVSNTATDINGAGRITHRIMMRPSLIRRMQLVGAYCDVILPDQGLPAVKDAVKAKIDQTQGISPATYVEPGDQDRELFETYCEIEVPGFEHEIEDEESGERIATGLPLPYKVVIDKDSRKILEIRRNWEEEDQFCMPRNRIIAYIFIPGLGFYGIGLLNVLGNATKAVTAAWRLLIDAGMYSNFPGFLYLKALGKQLTNQFRVPPGGGQAIDATGNDIRQSVMPLPYKDPSSVFIQLIDSVATAAQRVGGTAELQIGEGKQNAPVGTTLALIEQATRLMSAVHKRMHTAQGQELDMLKSLLMEDPEALWRHHKKSKVLKILTAMAGQQPIVDQLEQAEDKHRAIFLAALGNVELTPRSDPNTSSNTERYMKVVAARQMAQSNPNIDINAVDKKAFQTMGWDPESMFKPPPAPGAQSPPSPEQITAQATMLAAQARLADASTRERATTIKAQSDASMQASKEKIASLQVARELIIHNDTQNRTAETQGIANRDAASDRIHKLALANMAGRHRHALTLADNTHAASEAALDRNHEAGMATGGRLHDMGLAAAGRQHEFFSDMLDRRHEARLDGVTRQHEAQQSEVDRRHEARQEELSRKHERALQALAPAEGVAQRARGGRVEAPSSSEIGELTMAVRQLIAVLQPS